MNQQILDNIEDVYPLSPVQRGMLFHALEGTGDQMYFFQVVLTVSGDVDFDIFRRAWQNLIDRHAILRTAFVWKNLGEPLQVVNRQASLVFEVREDFSRDPAAWEFEKETFLRSDRDRGLLLTRAPLMRLTALRMPDGRFTVVWSFHHLIADAWSQSLLLGELFQQYEAIRSGETLSWSPPASFRSYIEWLESRASAGETFWRQSLAGADANCKLRTRCVPDDTPGGRQSHRQLHRHLPAEESESLRQFARDRMITLSTLVQAAWSVLIAKCSGSNDVLFGVTVAIRPPELAASESIIGPMINTVPLRVQLNPEESRGQFVTRLQEHSFDVLEHAAASLLSIRQWAGLSGPSSLFESIVVFENTPFDAGVAEKIRELCQDWECVEPVNYALALKVLPTDRLKFTLAYDTARFSGEFAGRLLDHLRSLLEQISSNPARPVATLRLLTHARSSQAYGQAADERNVSTAAALFASVARQTPSAVAIETAGQCLSYEEVDRLAASFASRLRQAGVGPEIPVAVAMPRGFRQVVAALAVWKAGGAYAPVDINAPDQRLFFQLQSLKPGLILCREADLDRLAAAGPAMTVDLQLAERAARETAAPATAAEEPSDNAALSSAYIIFTSGSSGRPKGVVVSHSGLGNLVREQARLLDAGPEARVAQFASPSVDASLFEIALALFSGGTLVQAAEDEMLLGTALFEFLRRSAITHAVLTPSLLAALPYAELPSLRVLVAAGEACPPEVVRRWGTGRKLFNAYGPTEATIWSTVAEIAPGQAVTIGRAIRGVRADIVDLHGQPVGPEIIGELLLGGRSIARGYLNAPDVTAERFIPDDLGDSSGARRYKTGDLASYTQAGEIDFYGRADQQIKLRGYRIEIEEIEAVLRDHREVSASAGALIPEGNSTVLVAFAVLAPDANVDAAGLRSWLTQRLPEYSVPARIVIVPELPLTHGGKLNREALNRIATSGTLPAETLPPPDSPVEALLMKHWQAITGVPSVDRNQSLFDQAGDSLRFMELLARIGEELGVEVPIGQLFDDPTMIALARYLLENSESAESLNLRAKELLEAAACRASL